MWLLFAFSGPVLWAASTHIDKYLLERYFKNTDTTVLMVFTALLGLLMLPFVWLCKPEVLRIPLESICVMGASGVLYMGAMLFYLRALQSEEASVVAPLFQTSTLFTFVLAYFLLGETLRWTGLLGAALIILGVLSLSFNSTFRLQKFKGRLVLLMMGSTFVLALSSVIFKFYAVKDEFWATTFWMFVGEALFGVGILLIPRYSKQFFFLLKKNTGPLLAVNGANELINLGGGLGVRFASLLAPLVLVSAVSSTTTLFVFAFGILLSLFLPRLGREDLSRANLIRKGIAALIVTAGVLLANLRA